MMVGEASSRGRRDVRRARAREFALFTASTIMYQGARFLFSVAAARSLVPEDFTAWALVIALLVYAPSLLLGITNGMSRELPILLGRANDEAADRTVAATWTATIAAVTTILAGSALVAAGAPGIVSSSLLFGILASGTIVFGTQQFILRSRLRFDAASGQQATFGGLALIAAAILVSNGNASFATVAILYGAPMLIAVLLGVVLTPPPSLAHPDLGEMRRLAGIGLPIMLAGLIFSFFVTLDRWMAITLLGPERAAPYALASLVAAAMLVIPTVVSQQTYPRMAIARGSGASAAELREMARHQGLVAVGLVAPAAVVIVLFAWLGLPLALPRYVAAAPAIVVLSVGFVVLGYLTGYGNYLNVAGGQWRYLMAQLVGVACAIGLMFVGGRLFGLLGIAFGMAMSHLIYGIVLRAVAVGTELTSDDLPSDRGTGG